MNKKITLIFTVLCLYAISGVSVSAQAVFGSTLQPGQYCPVNTTVVYAMSSPVSERCVCPLGSILETPAMYGYTGNYQLICKSTTAQVIPTCQPQSSGMSYITLASECKCPDGSTVWSNNGYTNQCNWNTSVICWDGSTALTQSSCPVRNTYCSGQTYGCYIPPTSTICTANVTYYGTNTCTCPTNTTKSTNYGMHGNNSFTCVSYDNQLAGRCWDGSQMVNQFSCPAYKYCPNDYATKRALSYTCPVQTQTCWNGGVIPITQSCPVQQPTCNYYQYWNGYQCVSYYQPYTPYQQDYWYPPVYDWDWGYNWNNNYYY